MTGFTGFWNAAGDFCALALPGLYFESATNGLYSLLDALKPEMPRFRARCVLRVESTAVVLDGEEELSVLYASRNL